MAATITALTPTGNRHKVFGLCKRWMEAQTRMPDQWLIVDDGEIKVDVPDYVTLIKRERLKSDPRNTLNLNIGAALPDIIGDKIIIIEDDEYYAPEYIETIADMLDNYEIIGIGNSKYYHLSSGGYHRHQNMLHASLAQTAFRKSLLPVVAKALCIDSEFYLDINIWVSIIKDGLDADRMKIFVDDPDYLYVGIKGLMGKFGISGFWHTARNYIKFDYDRLLLKTWIPRDYQVYLDIINET